MAEPQESLLVSAAKGDTGALTTLLNYAGPQVRNQIQISNRWRSALDVDDVMQVTYLEAFLRIADFKPNGLPSFVSWLRRIAENNLRDAVRSLERLKRPPPQRRVQSPTSDESAVVLVELLGVTTTTPSRAMAAGELRSKLESTLDLLPDDYGKAVRLYDLEHRTIEETAAALGRSAGAVHMLRARAHDRMRELLEAEPAFFSAQA